MKFLNDVTITGNGADLSCAATVTFSGLSTTTGNYAVMVNNTSGVLKKRALGSNAFNSTTIPTNNNQLTNGAGYVTGDSRWSGGSSGLTASTGRTSLGATTVGEKLFTLSNPGAVRFIRLNADNSVSTLSASDFRTAIGAGTSSAAVNSGTVSEALSQGDLEESTASAIRSTIGAQGLLTAIQIIDWSSSQTQNIHANNYTNTTYSVGDGGLTQNNFTNTLKSKLDGIDAGATAYTLPAATSSVLGGVIYKSNTTNSVGPNQLTNTSARTYAVQKAATGNAMVVNVPWTSGVSDISDLDDATTETRGVMTAADKTKLDGIASNATASSGDMTLAGTQTVSGAKTFSTTQTVNSDIALRFGSASTFIEGATSGSKLMLNGQTDMFMRINGTTILQLDPNKAELAKPLDITDTTDSTDATGDTGALRTEGGASVAKKLYVGSTITGSADVIAYSDKRLKQNIETLDGKKVLEMRGVSFDRVDTGKASSGVIAQEIEKVAPELVIDDGNFKGVAYGNLVGYLIEAIKDQQKQINELKYILHGRPE